MIPCGIIEIAPKMANDIKVIGVRGGLAEALAALQDQESLARAVPANSLATAARAVPALSEVQRHKGLADALAAKPEFDLARAGADASRGAAQLANTTSLPLPALHAPQLVSHGEVIRSTKELGALVRAARRRMKLNQQRLADFAGVGRRFISELEAGKPTLEFDRVVKVCAACGIDLFARRRSEVP